MNFSFSTNKPTPIQSRLDQSIQCNAWKQNKDPKLTRLNVANCTFQSKVCVLHGVQLRKDCWWTLNWNKVAKIYMWKSKQGLSEGYLLHDLWTDDFLESLKELIWKSERATRRQQFHFLGETRMQVFQFLGLWLKCIFPSTIYTLITLKWIIPETTWIAFLIFWVVKLVKQRFLEP